MLTILPRFANFERINKETFRIEHHRRLVWNQIVSVTSLLNFLADAKGRVGTSAELIETAETKSDIFDHFTNNRAGPRGKVVFTTLYIEVVYLSVFIKVVDYYLRAVSASLYEPSLK